MSWRPEMKFNIDSHSWCNYGCLCTTVARLLYPWWLRFRRFIFFPHPVGHLQSLPYAVMIREVSFLNVSAGFRRLKQPLSETTKHSGVAERFITFITRVSSFDWTIRSVICAAHCYLARLCLLSLWCLFVLIMLFVVILCYLKLSYCQSTIIYLFVADFFYSLKFPHSPLVPENSRV